MADLPIVEIVGIGPAGPEMITKEVLDLIGDVSVRLLRTDRHPSAIAVRATASFDDHYERADTFDDVYTGIVDEVAALAAEHRRVVYAVPGSPWVLERTVKLLVKDPRITTTVHAGMSFLDLAYARLRVDPIETGMRLIDGHRFTTDAAGQTGPLLVAHCHARRVLSDIKLSVDDPPDEPITVLQRLGLPDEHIFDIEWADLDRVVDADHLTSIYIPHLGVPVGSSLLHLHEITRRLREQCPWDRGQTHASLARYAVEEAYELAEAIETGDDDELIGELGDVLFQVMLHSALGEESGRFSLAEVADTVAEKMIRRHPHVFAGLEVSGTAEIVDNWEAIKRVERGEAPDAAVGPFDRIAGNLPAASYAAEVLKAAAKGSPSVFAGA